MSDIGSQEALFLTISEELKLVDSIIEDSINSSSISIIKEVATHITLSGGKRFRPALAILSAKICGYSNERTAHLGAAIELIHTASLIHDDVLDSADLRRGVPTANAKWGNHLSILVGDFCLSLASYTLAKYTTREIIATLTDAARETTEGEVLEVVCSNDLSMTEDTYMNIIRHKTACLIAASCETGSLLAEAPKKLSKGLKNYGMNLGTAFQIVDDILDFTTESLNLGKNKGTDLREGKLTLPVIYALGKCRPSEKEIIKESLLAPTYSEEAFRSVVAIMDRYGCLHEAKATAEKFLSMAIDNLAPFKQSLEKEVLTKFANFVVNRKF